LYNEAKYYVKFLATWLSFSILDFGLKRKKKTKRASRGKKNPKEPQEAIMRAKILHFGWN